MSPHPGTIAAVVRAAVLTEFTIDSCIASTLAVVEVCRYFGISARPQPTTVRAYSPLAWQLRETVPVAAWPREAWSVGIDGVAPSNAHRWNGHLVAVTAGHLIDASLDQLARPHRCLHVAACAFALPAGWGWPLGYTNDEGTVVVYDQLDSGDWRYSPNWRRSQPAMRRVVGAAIRALRVKEEGHR